MVCPTAPRDTREKVTSVVFKTPVRKLIIELWLLTLGGFLLHNHMHPIPTALHPQPAADILPFTWDIVALVTLPILLNYRKTVIVGYLINGIGVIVGTAAMATFGFAKPPHPLTVASFFVATTVPEILIVSSKLFIGQIVLLNFYPQGLGRVFTPFWWARHYVYIGGIFTIGHLVWR